ncbi:MULTISPECIES: helix-turn-helix domain-containing protein [Stappiaceae]|jgi:transcriptional regulator with XRE-family HTH domain|uniref:helix-turn-helix domain-containing protein n=1 Tax=Stappiaceae TaxID=2821832 RepID=UPI0007854D95|nr:MULTISPECIES: LexA family transcriptional regulator [Stappiaceae]UES36738.1 helix-turn-helix domain-containing protein [Roseibium aggregatum]
MSWHERIIKRRKLLGYSRAALARAAGVSYDNLNKYERGEVDHPRGDTLAKIANALGTTEGALLFGDLIEMAAIKRNGTTVPICGEVAAGLWMEADLFEGERGARSTVLGDSRYPTELQYLLTIKGESLNRVARDGDLILCLNYAQAGIELQSGDLVVVERTRDGGQTIERTAKRLVQSADGLQLHPESNDPRFQDPIVFNEGDEEVTQVRIVAKALSILRLLP